jgi:predicted RNase H-like nuclease (RuvC/YqgF family)
MSKHYLSKEHQCAIIAFIIRDLPKVIIDQPEGGVEMDVDNLPHTTTSLSGDSNAQLKEVDETVDVLAGGVQALNEDAQRLEGESAHYKNILEKLTNDFEKLKLSIQEQNAFLDGLKPNQEILSQEVASLKQKLEDLQSVSYDGTLIWIITDFAKKMGETLINKICFYKKILLFSS